ncbi:hypothetical protein BSKO_00733 [Bryopsis sp. KO-2023]|nr:hypothetical protein BSKO_00733 [Bryopsis sp. KO-2023]
MKLVESTVEALSTSSAPATVVEGLVLLRGCCFDAKKVGEVLDLLGESNPAGFLEIWELHVKTKEAPVRAELFLLFTVLLGLRKHPETQQHQKRNRIKQLLEEVGLELGTSWLKELIKSLNSKDSARVNAAFCLFAALAEIGEGVAARVVDALKRSSNSGPAKVDFWDICFQRWEATDERAKTRKKRDPLSLEELIRTPHRDCFLNMTLALLHNCNTVCFLTLLSTKSFMSALLLKLSFDRPEVIQQVLDVLVRRTVGVDSDVPPKLKGEVFTPGTLCQLVFISGRSGAEAHLAGKLLLELCTNPRHGLLPCRNSTEDEQANAFRNMMEFIAFLKPHIRSRHWFFLAKICRSCSRVAAECLVLGKINLNAQNPQEFVTGMGVLTDLIKYAGGCRAELVSGAQSRRLPPQNDDALVDRLIGWCVPPQVNKVTMGKFLQSKHPLICYGAIACLRRILLSIADLLAVIETACGWETVSLKLKVKLANLLPPHSVLMKVYWLQYKTNEPDGKDLDEEMADGDGESSSSLRDRKILLLNGILGILELCWKIGPEMMPQGSLEALMNVLTEDIVGKDPAYQLAVIHALEQATKNRGAGYMRTLIPQKLKPIMRLLTETGCPEVFHASEKLLMGWLAKFGFASTELEAMTVWLSLMPGKASGQIANRRHHAVLSFFTDVVCRMIRNPQTLYETQAELLRDFNCASKGDDSELGLMGTGMLFNCLQVLFSPSQPSMEKVWISSYVASTVNLFLLSSTCPIPLIITIHGMLSKASHKGNSKNGSGTRADKSRGSMPREGFPLGSLWSACTLVLRNVADANPAILDKWVEEAVLSISADAFRSQILALECCVSGPDSEVDEQTLQDQMDKAWSGGSDDCSLNDQSRSPGGSVEGESNMQTSLLSLPGTQALGFLSSVIEKQPSWLRNQEFLSISSEVLKGHCMPEGAGEFLSKALNASKDCLQSFSLCLLIKVTMESKEMQENRDLMCWLLERIRRIPETWRMFLIKYVLGALNRIKPSEGGAMKVAIALLEGHLFATELTLQELERFVTPILSHPALCEALSRDESGASTESIALFLKKVISKLEDGPPGCRGRIVHAMQNLFGCMSKKYAGGRTDIDKAIARALTSVGPYVEAPLRESIVKTIRRKQTKRKQLTVSSSIRGLLLSFAWLDCDGGLRFDWKSVGFLLGMDGLNPDSEKVLLEGLESDTPVDGSIFSKKISLVAIMERCLADPEGLKGKIAAKLVKTEAACRRMYMEDVVKKKSDIDYLTLCLPVAVNYLRGLSVHRSRKEVVTQVYGSTLVELFMGISKDFSKMQLADEGKQKLKEFGSQALMLCIKCGEKTLWKKCWSDLLPALLPEKCWLEKPDVWRTELLVLSGFIANHQLTQGSVTAKSRGKALDRLSHLVSTCCVTFCNLVKQRSKGNGGNAQELAYISDLLDGCFGDYLAELPNEFRTSASFDEVCTVAEKLAMSVMKYALNSPGEIRVVRRLFASLIPKEAATTAQQDHEMVDAGKSTTENPRAVLVAKKVLDALLSHSGFVAAQQPHKPPLSSSLTPGAANLVYPVGSVLSVMESDIGASRGSSDITVGTLRTELAVLIETLLNMQTEFGLKIDKNSAEISRESNLMAVLLVGYGASLSSEDIAVLHVLKLLDDRLGQRLNQGPASSSQNNPSPLENLGYIWGNDALKLHLAGLLVPRISATSSPLENDEFCKLIWHTGPNAYHRRSGMTTVYFPELRTLDGFEGAEEIWGRAGACGFDGGCDPAFLLRFCKVVVDRGVGKEDFWKSGLLALCLRASAAADAKLRKMAVEVVAKYRSWLSDSNLKESSGILHLLRHFLVAVGEADQKLPTVVSVFFAEACMQLTSKENAMHATISNVCMETEEWDVSAVPMWRKLSSCVDQNGGQGWMVNLLAAGMMGTDSCMLYERCKIFPALLALHDSKLAHPETRRMAIRVARKVTEIPTLAETLVDSAGLVLWLGDRAVHSGWQPSTVSSKLDNTEPNYPCAIASIRALRSLVTGNIGLSQRGGLLNDYIRTGWVLCKMVTNYYEKEAGVGEVDVDQRSQLLKGSAENKNKKMGSKTSAGLKVGWSEKRGRLVGVMWWEVVLYMEALMKVCSEGGVASMSDVLEWKHLCDLLDGGGVFGDWIDVGQTEIDKRLLEIVLKMATGVNDRVVEAEASPYWERSVLWGLPAMMSCREKAVESGDVVEVETSIRKSPKSAENLDRGARFLLWMGSCLLKGMRFPSELNESHLEDLIRLHYDLTGEDQDATVLALLICVVHLAQPAIEKFKKMNEALGSIDMIENVLPEMMSQVGFSRSALLCVWNKSSALGIRGSIQNPSETPRIILSMIRELVGGSTRFDLTEKHLSYLKGISGQAGE